MNKIKLFSGNGNVPLANSIAHEMGLRLSEISWRRFSDDEMYLQIKENVRGADVFFIQSLSAPASDNLMELFFAVDALKRASAGRVTAVTPYFCYARQDRKDRPRVPISARVVADLLETVHIDRLLTMDLHAAQIQGFFRIPVDHLIAAPIMAEYYHKQALGPDVTVVSPDIGGTARARSFSDRMGAPLAIIDKRRPEPNVSEVMNIIGAVKGRKCIMVDDLADTAGTLAKGAVALMEAGAVSVSACATHGVLSNGAQDKINDSVLTELVVTDTIPGHIQSDKMRTLTVAGLFARAIWAIHEELSVASLFK